MSLIIHEPEEAARTLERILEVAKENENRGINSSRLVQRNLVKTKFSRGDGINDGNGLLLTGNGYMVTAWHVIREYEEDWNIARALIGADNRHARRVLRACRETYRVEDSWGISYPLDFSYWYSRPDVDLALVKAVMPGEPEPVPYGIRSSELSEGETVRVQGYLRGKFVRDAGNFLRRVKVAQTESVVRDTHLSSIIIKPGLSGSAILTREGALAGINLYATREYCCPSGSARAKNILRLVSCAAKEIGELVGRAA